MARSGHEMGAHEHTKTVDYDLFKSIIVNFEHLNDCLVHFRIKSGSSSETRLARCLPFERASLECPCSDSFVLPVRACASC